MVLAFYVLQLRARCRICLRNDLFTHLTLLDRSFYERLKTGDLMSRMINDLSAVRMMVGMGALSFADTPVTYIYALSFMVALSRG